MIIELEEMNNHQIDQVLSTHPDTSDSFLGVFPRDRIPMQDLCYPCSIVLNTDKSNDPGTHWVCVYFNYNDGAEWFDSYGLSPQYKEFRNVVNTANYWSYNSIQLQSFFTTTCGLWCIYYIIHRANDIPANDIVNYFSSSYSLLANDAYIEDLAKSVLPVPKSLNFSAVSFNQCCKSFHD